jgi:hypothetical protein
VPIDSRLLPVGLCIQEQEEISQSQCSGNCGVLRVVNPINRIGFKQRSESK